jgi:hypothetical protein
MSSSSIAVAVGIVSALGVSQATLTMLSLDACMIEAAAEHAGMRLHWITTRSVRAETQHIAPYI